MSLATEAMDPIKRGQAMVSPSEAREGDLSKFLIDSLREIGLLANKMRPYGLIFPGNEAPEQLQLEKRSVEDRDVIGSASF